MGMFSEISTESTIYRIVQLLLPLFRTAEGERRNAYKQAIEVALGEFAWTSPEWAKKVEDEINERTTQR